MQKFSSALIMKIDSHEMKFLICFITVFIAKDLGISFDQVGFALLCYG